MSNSNNKLKEYINDTYYSLQTLDFFEAFNHLGKCGEEKYNFYSEVYKQYINNLTYKDTIANRLDEEKTDYYFSCIFSDEQLFAIIFAYANNLDDKQIRKIANLNNFRRSWSILDKYLREKHSNGEKLNYYVAINGNEIPAVLNKQHIQIFNCNDMLKIL